MEVSNSFDAVIIGAGAAGLIAALELSLAGKNIAILEARDRAGGRIYTIDDQGFDGPIEMGAEFVHGKLEITLELLKKADANKTKVEGDIWRKKEEGFEKEEGFIEAYDEVQKKLKELKNDIPVKQFLIEYLNEPKYKQTRQSIKSYVEGYSAANLNRASTFAFRKDLQNSEEDQYRPEGGYQKIVNYLLTELKNKNVPLFFNEVVTGIEWQKDEVHIISTKQNFKAKKVLVTVPLGVLQNDVIKFTPLLPDKIRAAKALGFGSVIKWILQFDEAFWSEKKYTGNKDLVNMGFLFSEETIPTWWTQFPKKHAILTGWLGGPNAELLKDLNDEALLQKALQSLGNLFTISIADLKQKLKAWKVCNWSKDPFSYGAYSYTTLDHQKNVQTLKSPVENTLFFAGEGIYDGDDIGTVEAALSSGKDTAQKMIATF
jgi:monoamine oxidase